MILYYTNVQKFGVHEKTLVIYSNVYYTVYIIALQHFVNECCNIL